MAPENWGGQLAQELSRLATVASTTGACDGKELLAVLWSRRSIVLHVRGSDRGFMVTRSMSDQFPGEEVLLIKGHESRMLAREWRVKGGTEALFSAGDETVTIGEMAARLVREVCK